MIQVLQCDAASIASAGCVLASGTLNKPTSPPSVSDDDEDTSMLCDPANRSQRKLPLASKTTSSLAAVCGGIVASN